MMQSISLTRMLENIKNLAESGKGETVEFTAAVEKYTESANNPEYAWDVSAAITFLTKNPINGLENERMIKELEFLEKQYYGN